MTIFIRVMPVRQNIMQRCQFKKNIGTRSGISGRMNRTLCHFRLNASVNPSFRAQRKRSREILYLGTADPSASLGMTGKNSSTLVALGMTGKNSSTLVALVLTKQNSRHLAAFRVA